MEAKRRIYGHFDIKNVTDGLYRKIQVRANKKHRSIAQEVVHILTQVT